MSRRLGRWARSAVLALVAGGLLIPAAATASPAVALATSDTASAATSPAASAVAADPVMPVRVEITQIAPVVLRPGEDLVVRATLHNDGATALEHAAAALRINSFRISTREDVGAWAERADTDLAGQSKIVEPLEDPLAPGASASVVLTLPAARIPFFDLPGVWGPRGLAVEATNSGTRVGLERTFVLWYPEESVTPVPVSVLLPLTGPPEDPLSTEPDTALEAASAPEGPLGRTLQAAEVDPAIGLVVDPSLVGRAQAGGSASEAWAARVSAAAAEHDTFTLPWADPDVSALAQADRPDLLDAAMALSRTSDAVGTGRRTMTWSAVGQVLDQPTATLAAGAGVAAVVAANPAIGAASSNTHSVIDTESGRVDRLVPDGTLSAMLVDPKAVEPAGTPAIVAQRALAELAVVAREHDDQPRPVLLTPGRDATPDPAAVATLMTAFRDAPWVQVDSASTLLVGPAGEAAQRPRDGHDDSELAPASVDALAEAREHAVAFSSVTPDPSALLAGVDQETLAPLSLAWRADPTGRGELVKAVVKTVTARTVGLSIAPLSDINVLSASADMRVVVRNDLDVTAEVQLVMTPRKACLRVEPIDPVTVDAVSSTSISVRLRAAANCDVEVTASLESSDGATVALPRVFSARVAPTIESVGTYVVGALLAIGLVLGIVRTVRRGQSARRGARTEAETGPAPPLPVLGGVPDEEAGP
ncbi:DUF6049 family protein [Cellulomonas edaphi]|uniref:DUF6049 family protein n=1 Tax=Cellulomonas edaphi TaxID=3053468 RepID=A0ABT7S3E4_9CELL|nr:DUF6049 family protein [Cellulomons edaphi]MDM7830141.1 DUF6049 family protein [Cellulomons edaphi]